MATVLPFRGLLYGTSRVPDLKEVVAPPYDVLSPAMAGDLRARDPHNVVHIDLPEGEAPEKYARAAAVVSSWVEQGVLVRDPEPAIYAMSQRFAVRGMPERTRWGFFALLRIESDEAKVVLPHERTMDAPRSDRLDLMAATRTQLSPIFVLYSDPETRVSSLVESAAHRPADRWVSDDAGVDTRLWRIADPDVIHGVCDGLAGRKIWIADGHHRYAAARELRDRLRATNPDAPAGSRAHDYVLAYLCNVDSPGVTILPYHRVVRGVAGFDSGRMLREAERCFELKRFSFEGLDHRAEQIRRRLREVSERGRLVIGVYRGGAEFTILALKDPEDSATLRPLLADLPGPLQELDVAILHRIVFQEILDLSAEAQRSAGHVRYSADAERTIDWVDSGEGQAAFLLAAPKRGQMMAVAEAGLQMPQKSTYFYPKVLTGLILNPLEPAGDVAAVPDRAADRP